MTGIPVRYLRIIVTNRCNLSCYYCHAEGIQLNAPTKKELSSHEIITFARMGYAIGIRKFKIMGGEPTLRRDLRDIIRGLRQISSEIDISMVTNGTALLSSVESYLAAGLDRINISLHGWELRRHLALIKGTLVTHKRMLQAIEVLASRKVISKVNYLLLKGDNEKEFLDVIPWSARIGVILNVLNVVYGPREEPFLKQRYYSYQEILEFIRKHFTITRIKKTPSLYSLETTDIFLANGAIIRFKDTPLNKINPFKACKTCPVHKYCTEGILAIRLTEDGFIKPCLLRNDNYFPIKSYYYQYGYEETLNKLRTYLSNL